MPTRKPRARLATTRAHSCTRNIFDLIHPDDRAYTSRLFGQLIARPDSSASGAFRFQHADGTWRWLEGTGTSRLHVRGINAIVAQFWERDNANPGVAGTPLLELAEQ